MKLAPDLFKRLKKHILSLHVSDVPVKIMADNRYDIAVAVVQLVSKDIKIEQSNDGFGCWCAEELVALQLEAVFTGQAMQKASVLSCFTFEELQAIATSIGVSIEKRTTPFDAMLNVFLEKHPSCIQATIKSANDLQSLAQDIALWHK